MANSLDSLRPLVERICGEVDVTNILAQIAYECGTSNVARIEAVLRRMLEMGLTGQAVITAYERCERDYAELVRRIEAGDRSALD